MANQKTIKPNYDNDRKYRNGLYDEIYDPEEDYDDNDSFNENGNHKKSKLQYFTE